MAEVARRAGVGMATLYRNFPGRPELLDALFADEVDVICQAAADGEDFVSWLRRNFAFARGKRAVAADLLGPGYTPGTDMSGAALPSRRGKAIEAGRPLLARAQTAGEIRDDLSLEQIFDLIVAIATAPGDDAYHKPMLETLLDGLRR